MLDPRVYRAGLIVAALALVVLAFSLQNQQGPLAPTLSPQAFNGQNVLLTLSSLSAADPVRAPGSNGDNDLATTVSGRLAAYGFAPTTDAYTGRTVDGTRTLENVVATRPGAESGSIVLIAPRDVPGAAGLSGTATLIELARVLAGETLHHTIVLASTSGSQGTAGAVQLASSLPGPLDAVIVLGDLASAHVSQPIVIPWSMRPVVAPPVLRNTLAAAIAGQTNLTVGSAGFAGQFAHLALPLTLGLQAPFGDAGVPAVTLSLSGERGPSGQSAVNDSSLTGLGQAVLEAVSALDSQPALPAPSRYLLLNGKVVPGWAIALFVLALIVPVILTTVDGVARARRRGHLVGRSVVLVLGAAVPFALGALVVIVARVIGVLDAAPPGPAAAGAVPLTAAGIAVLAVAALVVVGATAWVAVLAAGQGARRPRVTGRGAAGAGEARPRSPGRAAQSSVGGHAAGLLVVLCCVTLAIWVTNPFAAALLVPALHLWLWAIDADLPLPVAARLALLVLGVAPLVWVAVYYAGALGFSPAQLLWAAALLVAGHGVGVAAAAEWCVVAGCVCGASAICVLASRGSSDAPATVTVRGPITYAGPGSLGGTKSALRR